MTPTPRDWPDKLRQWANNGDMPIDGLDAADAWEVDIAERNNWMTACIRAFEQLAASEQARQTEGHIAGLAVSLLREAFLFNGYGEGPLSHNAPAIQMVLRDFAALAPDAPAGPKPEVPGGQE